MSIIKHKSQRVAVLIDVQNMYHSAKNLYHSRVNFKELLKIATANRELVRAVAYVVKSDTDEEKAFFNALEKSGYELKSKDLQIFPGGMKKGDWDVAIAIDAITLAKLVDVIVIVSGDGDYEPLVDYLKFNGNIVEVAGFGRSTSARLIESAHNFTDLDEVTDKVILK